MAKGPTKREFDAQLRALRDPPPMNIDQALASDDPLHEIDVRLRKPVELMSEPEKVFWAVSYFLGDTLNGGLIQTMTNSTGDFLEVVGEFARRYGPPELVTIVAGIHAVFPGGHAFATREERLEFFEPIIEAGLDEQSDPFDELTTRFFEIEGAIGASLLEMAKRNRAAFDLLPPAGTGP